MIFIRMIVHNISQNDIKQNEAQQTDAQQNAMQLNNIQHYCNGHNGILEWYLAKCHATKQYIKADNKTVKISLRSSDRHYGECHWAECRGTFKRPNLKRLMTVLCDSLSDQKIDQIKVVKNIRPVLSKTKVLGPILQTFYGRNYATSGVFLYDGLML